MAILDDFTVDYVDKKIRHTSGTTIYDVNALYSALQDTFDELGQMDDDIPMSAQTPTEYTLINGWYMGDIDMQFLQNGAIQTNGWASDEVIRVSYTESVALSESDIGTTITTSSYTGKILDYGS